MKPSFLKRNAAVLLVAGVVLGGGAYAVAQEQPEDPAPSQDENEESPDGEARHHRRHLPFLGAVHGDLIVPDGEGGFREVIVDRGELTVEGDSVTIDRPDGESVTRVLTEDTRYRGVDSAAGVRAGEPGIVVADGDGNALTVAQPTEEQRDRFKRFSERRRGGNENARSGVPTDEGQAPAA